MATRAPMDLWADKQALGDSRIKALLAEDFETGYLDDDEARAERDLKLRFWKDMIQRFCETRGRVSCNTQDLKAAFVWNGLQPMGMPIVLHHMENEGDAVSLDRVVRGDYGEQTLVKSSLRLLASPAKALKSWILGEDPACTGVTRGQESTVVIMPVLKKLAGVAEKEFRARGGTLLDLIVTRDEASHFVLGVSSRNEQDIVLDYLVRKKIVSSFRLDNGIEGLRLLERGNTIEPDTEKELLQLRLIWNQLESEIASLESRQNELQEGIRDALRRKLKQRALGLLRISKQLDTFADRRRSHMLKIREMTTTLEDAVLNTKTLDALAKGSQAISKVNNAIRAEGDLDKRLDDMNEAMADAKDISDAVDAAMSGVGESVDEYDEEELEKELDDLMAAETLKKLETLSVVPTGPAAADPQDKCDVHESDNTKKELAEIA